jgi:single-strand DNA-binding protein
MYLVGIARLGRDAELRTAGNGETVANLNVAFNYGRPDSEGKKPTQWCELALWGRRAEALAPHLLKGTVLSLNCDDVHIEEFRKRDGTTGSKLSGRVISLEFAGSSKPREYGDKPPQSQPRAAQPKAESGFDDMDDDIPF